MDNNNVYHNFPKHDYALAILSQAAMHAPVPNAFTQENSQPSQITNQQTLHNQSHHSAHPHRGTASGTSLGDHNHSASSSRNMETLTYGTQITRPDVYVPQTYPGMGSGQYSSHLGILNAEQYDNGRSMMRSHEASEMRLKQQQEAPMPFGITSGPQLGTSSEENDGGNVNTRRGKRMRAEMSTADEEDWAAKKARGRPRVDTKDETAADRRRTQIRMAQRAYRHRKETTISSLEKQVQELRGTNEEMSNTIISLYDFAIGKGMLQREPEFGQQLQSTIERILALAKASSSEDGTKDEEYQVEEEVKQDQIEAFKPETNRRTKGRKRSPKVSPPEPPPPQLEAAPVNTWGGYEISKEDSVEPQVYQQQQQQQQQQAQAQAQERTRSGEHQIISLATEENASFPFDFMDLQQHRVELPSTEYYTQDFFSQATLPLPPTHAPQEYSFARRIKRGALEKAFTLITMQNPPQQRFQGVFGLCLLYESKDEVRARLQRCLSASSAKDPLQEWRAPFVHIGGAGTFYPKYESVEHMPKFRTGYSMGPQSPLVAAAEEKIQDPIRCKLPGFEGEFFDASDVEGYLRGRGLEIPPNADFVTAQLDLRALGPRTKSSETTTTISSPDLATGHTVGIQGLLGLPNDQNSYAGELRDTGTNNTSYDHLANSACSLEFPLGFANWDESVFGKSNTNIDPIFNRVSATQEARMNSNDASTDSLYQHTITIDINTFMQELIGKAICLGRGPGFRPSDVNAAIITAIRAGAGA